MQLEIKHVKGYLGTGVKFRYTKTEEYENSFFKIGEDEGVRELSVISMMAMVNVNECYKLILRPLSDLTKEIEHNGEKFVPVDRLHLKHEPSDNISIFDFYTKGNLGMEDILFIIEKLYEWHFDVHNLIEQGKAINLNDLK